MLKHRSLLRRLWRKTPDRPERLIVRWIDHNDIAATKDTREKPEQNVSSPEPPKPESEPCQP